MSTRGIVTIVMTIVTLIVTVAIFKGMTGYVPLSQFHVWQGVTGNVDVIDSPGYYWNNFGTEYEYPKTIQKAYTPEEAITARFNDNGRGKVIPFVQISLPTDKALRIKLQEKFSGNKDNILAAVNAHLTNCITSAGPIMSASENQASRKSEFLQTIEDQLKNGLFQMRRTRVQLKDRVDDKGAPIFVEATEPVLDAQGVPTRQGQSPLAEYGITVTQFSILGDIDYDDLTKAQFTAKQEAYLATEQSKAKRDQELQQRLFVVAEGERKAAEETAKGNVLKAQAEVAAQTKVAVAEQAKLEAETVAAQKVAVAELAKKEAETRAEQESEVARIAAEQQKNVVILAATAQKEAAALEAEGAKLKATGIIALAEAKQKEIALGGAVTEEARVLATIAAERDVNVANALSRVAVPSSIFIGGSGSGTNGTASGIDPLLLNLNLLRGTGLMDFSKSPNTPVPLAPTPANVEKK